MTFQEKVEFAKGLLEKRRNMPDPLVEVVAIRAMRSLYPQRQRKEFDRFFNETFKPGGFYPFVARELGYHIVLTMANKCFARKGYQLVAGEYQYFIRFLPYTSGDTYEEMVELWGRPE